MRMWLTPILLFITGGLFTLGLAPFFYWPVTLVSLVVLYHALHTCSSDRQSFFRTWLFSFAQFLTGVSWIYVSMHDHGGTPVWLAVPAVAAFAAFLALIPAATIASVWALQRRWLSQSIAWLTFSGAWFLCEWVRSWLLTGFPWLFAGDAHIHSPLAGWAPILGSYGSSFICALTASTCYVSITRSARKRHGAKRFIPLLATLCLWASGYWLQSIEWTKNQGELVISTVQGNIPQEIKWKREQTKRSLRTYTSHTRKHWESDVILWPETAVTVVQDRFIDYRHRLHNEALKYNSTVIYGIPYRHPKSSPLAGEFHNSIMLAGHGEGVYHKQRLVPFGEYVPFEKWIRGLIPFFDLEMSSFLAGQENQPLLKITRTRNGQEQLFLIAPFICYEIAYPDLVRTNSKGADVLITLSNDAWFGDSLGPKQHMALAQMRALETQRYVVRATNTGISGIINEKGTIIKRLEPNTVATLTGTVQGRQGITPYMQWGVWPLLLLTLCGWVIGMILKQRERRYLSS